MARLPTMLLNYSQWCSILLFFSSTSHIVTAQSQSQYEYVVIGSGPGGGPLAANLAREGHSVLIIEAGEDHGDSRLQRIPVMANTASEDPTMSWDFFVEHYSDPEQAHRDSKYTWRKTNGEYYIGTDPPAGAEPVGILYPRTGTLGGCSNHNAMNFALPPDDDWDLIAQAVGDDSWNSTSMRTYFEKIEHCNYLPEGTEGHGFSGWLGSNLNKLELLSGDESFMSVVRTAMTVTGDAENPTDQEIIDLLHRDMNRDDPQRYEHEGLYMNPNHVDARYRRSSAQTYLRDTINELNSDGTQRYPLTISTSSLATRVIFNNGSSSGSPPKAVGVEYLQGTALYKADRRYDGTQVGIPMTAYASKEVIVAGGAFNTPQILKLSGLGPREELEQFDIPVVVDLPAVGTHLQDNYETGVDARASVDFHQSFENCTFLMPGDPCLRQWQDAEGPYTQGGAPVSMWMRSSQSHNNDSDLFFFGGSQGYFAGFYPGYSRATAPPSTWWWSIVKMQVGNRAGTVKLRSADPQDTPIINFNYFEDARDKDLTAIAEGVQLAKRIYDATDAPVAPFSQVEPDQDVRQHILDESYSHHACGSCPMGEDRESSCVDSQFRVHGVENLRIVDGSIFPRQPGAFPILPTFMISEKATDVILGGSQ